AALADPRVSSIHVIEALSEVIDWHARGLVPLGHELTADERCTFVHGDFFAMIAAGLPIEIGDSLDALLLDIDHTPGHLLNADHATFYHPEGLRRVVDHLRPGGAFSLWSDEFSPNAEFVTVLESVFATVDAHVVDFPNHYTGGESTSTIYVAGTAD
ncbi:MAG: spermidine synthase, partial [Ilumatobacteraceae bacterium]